MSQKQQKGKQGTKGIKQIVEENQQTLSFYRNMVFISNAVFLSVTAVLFDLFTTVNIVMLVFSALVYVGSYQFMVYMARAKYTDSGQLFDSGVDLNMEGGIAEHVKDLIILTSISQMLSLFSNYFWWLWALAPARGFWMLWKNVLGPWFFQPAPEDPQMDPKKQRKIERKMARGRY
ncbi:Transmembrane protein 208 [Frankliniella fusca]|uniref:Transmembrane protein 208 n=1 Tax=Frankliniella fusca TaxID=407009 RepID=A0AAE1LM14_9NEOP|nr:Transmembrane protein 208 [Frankliniella fusca]